MAIDPIFCGTSHARNSRLGVVLDFGDDEITLLGVAATQLTADDFVI